MIIKKITLEEILAFLGDEVIAVKGEKAGVYIDNLADVEHTNSTTLDWVLPKKAEKQHIAEQSKARVLLVDDEVDVIAGKTLIAVKSPKRSLAAIGNHFFVPKHPIGIHPTAIVDSEAQLGRDVYIGPYAVVGKAKIGDGCVIESGVRVYDNVEMGRCCNIKSGAVLGGEGFGFERDENGNRFRFPQIGRLLMGDYVEVGGNTCIDRGALSDTVIGDYTKINNLCHIAHNNRIGKNVVVTACVNLSGGNVIEDDAWIAPNASLKGYIHVGEGAVVGMSAVVTKDVPAHETWVGNPARELKR